MLVCSDDAGFLFQSTLPCGSDIKSILRVMLKPYFNPRSLAGATKSLVTKHNKNINFNPRSLAGATYSQSPKITICLFQSTLPCGSDTNYCRSFFWQFGFQSTLPCGSDIGHINSKMLISLFQSTLPCGSDSIKTNYFSINLSQAFFANRLNSNTQEFYFDVRKLLVSHSSPGCEPKLNYMFHITSHRIILHYFSSCQSICK